MGMQIASVPFAGQAEGKVLQEKTPGFHSQRG
jgi:hypothetical protein